MGKHKHKSGSDSSTVEDDIIPDEYNDSIEIKNHKKNKHKKLATDNPGETQPSTSKKHKRRKSQDTIIKQEEATVKEEVPESVETQLVKPKKKRKVKIEQVKIDSINDANHDNELNEFNVEVKEADNDEEEEIQIPAEHLPKLLNQIEKALPDNDTMMYLSRAKKLDWNEVAFYDYSADKCREAWHLIQKRQRHYRLLSEVLTDSKEWVKRPWQNFNKGTKNKLIIHPDYPKKPLSSYMLFYLERRDPIMSENPGIKMPELSRIIATQYNELPEDVKVTYLQLASAKRATFDQEVEEFYNKHPEVPRERNTDRGGSKPPKKPPTPFIIFFEEQLKKSVGITDRAVYKEACKEKWKMLSEKKKMIWIEWAVKLENKYQIEMKEFLAYHPNYKIKDKKILTKEEIMLKEKMEGKPEKPPNSSYSLFCTMLLKSEEYKVYDAKERLKLIAAKWKTLPQAEKDKYKLQTQHLVEQYKQDYAAYLDTLPDDRRADELNKTKRGAKPKTLEEQPPPKKVKTEIEEEEQDDNTMDTAALPKFEHPLKELVTPETWEDMSEREKAMYMKYIQKIKGYFDNQHRTASKYRETSTSDSESDSSDTE